VEKAVLKRKDSGTNEKIEVLHPRCCDPQSVSEKHSPDFHPRLLSLEALQLPLASSDNADVPTNLPAI
jgi:hypothetical protein